MTTTQLQRLGFFSLVILVTAVGADAFGADDPPKEKFVVHEWGVAIRSQAQTQNLLAPPDELIKGLPNFVLRHEQAFKPTRKNLGWDKPVIHFYGAEGTEVMVHIEFPMGQPLAYWPAPTKYLERVGKQITSRKEMMIYTLSEATGCDWKGTLSAKPANDLAAAPAEHWWAGVRDVPGMYFNCGKTSERFLFYEGTAKQEPPVSAAVSDDAIVVRNVGNSASGSVMIIVNDGKTRWAEVVKTIDPAGAVKISRDQLTSRASTDEQILRACETQWTDAGMTAAEAHAIVQTWKPDLLGRVGILLISRMPPRLYDGIFPLVILPRPDELVRVGMVFDPLDGQDARAAWLPALRETFDGFAKQLGDEDSKVRRAAERRFASFGDLAKTYLSTLARNTDPEIANSARVLLKELEPKPVPPAIKQSNSGRREE